jgi:hypothetical protein
MVKMLAALVAGAGATSISNCGGAGDHLQVTTLTLDADASGGPKKGSPFTIVAEGILDEPHVGGHVDVDLNINALGVINEPIAAATKYDFLPGLAQGNAKVTIGPITFPKSVPGSFDITGTVKVQNPNAEQVACINLNLKIPSIIEDKPELGEAVGADCTTPADHIQNIVSTTDAAGVTTTTMDVDEDLGTIVLSGDISVKPPLVPAIKVNIPSIPISIEPAIPSGQLKFVDYGEETGANGLIDVTGQVKLADGNGEQLTCIAIEPATQAVTV